MKKIKLAGKIVLISAGALVIVYLAAFVWADMFAESRSTEVVIIDAVVELDSAYNTEDFKKLSSVTDGELKNTTIYSVHEKEDSSAALYTFQKEYTYIGELFFTSYTPIKEVQIYYDRSTHTVVEMTVMSGNSLLMDSRYLENGRWTQTELGQGA